MKNINRVEFIAHKGKQVLLLDLTNCGPEELMSVSDEAERVITAQAENSVLVLAPSRAHSSAETRSLGSKK
jgi:hypothetical protein